MKDKALIVVPTRDAPWFLGHLLQSFNIRDPGYDCDLLIVDNDSSDKKHLQILERAAKKHRIESRENEGRAQGGYDFAWQNNKDYKYYFFMHDDSSFIRDGWLKLAIDRIEDESLEDVLKYRSDAFVLYPVGKVGFQAYEWGNKYEYFRTGYPQIFKYMDWIESVLDIKIPHAYQHINDDRYLIKNELLQKMETVWNIGEWKRLELESDDRFNKIDEWFTNNLPNKEPFPPYDWRYHAFQTVSEFLSDIAPMRYGYRTHCVLGDGFCQEELGWSKPWGNEYIVHYGNHSTFKFLSKKFHTPEEQVRARFKDQTFLSVCDSLIKKETSYVER